VSAAGRPVTARAAAIRNDNAAIALDASASDEAASRVEADLALMFQRPWTFIRSAPSIETLPSALLPEIAFAGRSNVGKSSLINALVNQIGLARTSNTPGRTQELVFFQPTAVPCILVDMPGYGYAKAPKAIVDAWTELVRAYLRGRTTLKRVLLLIDSRHGVKPTDREMMKLLDEAACSYHVVLTKTDKISAAALAEVAARTEEIIASRPAAFPGLVLTSSAKARGLDDLRAVITTTLRGV
jgi:GTP-binding protein